MDSRKEGVMVLLDDGDGRIAMQLRDDIYKWGIFGGWMEAGETPVRAAVREIGEELCSDLDPEKLELIRTFRMPRGNKGYAFFYAVTTELDDAVLTEGVEFRFLNVSELRDLPVVSWHLEFLVEFQKRDQREDG
jgi:8-oxo-dGTP pyrophosphatase MutT (NUDIX family)